MPGGVTNGASAVARDVRARVVVCAIVVALILGCGGPRRRDPRPNIVLVIADDHASMDLGFMGSPLAKTPTLDRLAAEGVVFTQGYVTASVCRPSLRTLLTGLGPLEWRLRLAELARQGRPADSGQEIASVPTLARLLTASGYVTFQGGKYWEGTYASGGFTHGTRPAGEPATFRDASGGEGLRLGRETMAPLLDFIDDHADRPFFVWFAPFLPHLPYDAPPEFWRDYADVPIAQSAKGYLANVTRLDAAIRTLLKHLETRGLRDSTLVVFVSDNGWDAWEPVMPQPSPPLPGWDPSWWGGPRGKMSLHEIGLRTPIVLSWPGIVASGRRSATLVSTEDLMPTLLDYAGVPVPRDLPGRSLRPILEGRAGRLRSAVVGWQEEVRPDTPQRVWLSAPQSGHYVRTARWHYVLYDADDREELYDLAADPARRRNVAIERPQVTSRMRRRIARWERAAARRAVRASKPVAEQG